MCTAWTPTSPIRPNAARFTPNTAANFTSNFASDYDLKESILAGYMMASGEFGPWEVIGGVRVENTDIDSSGYLLRGTTSQVAREFGGRLHRGAPRPAGQLPP